MSHRPTVLGSMFIFAYQGAEVAISGWIISFLIQMRNGDPSKVGYVTSGFWGGITVGKSNLLRKSRQLLTAFGSIHALISRAQNR